MAFTPPALGKRMSKWLPAPKPSRAPIHWDMVLLPRAMLAWLIVLVYGSSCQTWPCRPKVLSGKPPRPSGWSIRKRSGEPAMAVKIGVCGSPKVGVVVPGLIGNEFANVSVILIWLLSDAVV